MAYGVSLWFDRFSEDTIRSIWKALHEEGLSSFLWKGSFRPHVTLVIYETIDLVRLTAALNETLSQIAPFNLSFPSFGCFVGPPDEVSVSENAVVLNVTPTMQLLDFHARVHQLLSEYGTSPRPYDLPGQWNPHSTVAREVKRNSIPEILHVCHRFILPINATVNRIGVIDTPAEVELECCPLAG